MSELYALLIGVDFYFPNQLPGGGGYGHLGGCVRDVTHVEAHLRDRLGLPSSHIFKLTASYTGGAEPAEPRDQWPTYDNIVTAFRQVKALAQPGDRIYFHYAGHGGRTVTAFPELKTDGLDEGLVPTDIGNAHSNFLRDVEFHYLIQELLEEKQVILTVVLDSCHSGGATRAVEGQLSAVPRGTNQVDRAERPLRDLVAPYADLVTRWRTQQTATREHTRAVQDANGWLLEPKGYTLLAACRPNELAYEYPFNGVERNGALTYWLLDTLRQAGPRFTYKMLHDRVLAKVHGQFAQQTPMLQGESDVVVFGADRIKPYYAVPVIQVQGERVQINAGEAHGLTRGAQLAIYPLGTSDFQTTPRSALLELDQIDAVEAWGRLIEGSSASVEAGAQAVLLSIADLNFQRKVGLDVADPTVRQALETELATQGKGFARLADPGEAIDYFVELTEAGELVIEDAGDQPVPNLRPAIRADAPNGVSRTVERLVHLARYRGVQELQVNDPAAAQKLRVDLIGNEVNRPGDRVGLRVTNTQQPGDDSRTLNITVLALSSDWSISQIYPAGAGLFQPVSPGETINLQFDAYLPDGQTESSDVLKVFATTATTNFRWLELPALDQPITRSATRSAAMNPLEQLLAAVTEEQSTTRAVRLVSSSEDKAWTVAQVELRVEDPSERSAATPASLAMPSQRGQTMQYDLVFEGGGAKGMVLVGAYQVLAERGHTPGRLLGTSAGAITAALIAAGYTPQEMLDALTERAGNLPIFATFMGDPPPFDDKAVQESAIRSFLRDIDFTFIPNFLEDKIDDQIAQALASRGRGRNFFALVERGGWYSAHNFLSWMSRRLDTGTFRGQPRQFSKLTLAQFHAITQVDLSFVAADASGSRLLVLNHRTAPDCPLLYAVRMSMSIPLLWDEVIWQAEWGPYRGHDLTGHAIVDGGMLSNFPIELFISAEAPVTAIMGAKQNNPILGLLIDDTLPVPAPRGLLVNSNVQLGKLQTLQRLMRLINTATTAHDKMVIEAFEHLVVRLPAAGYGTTEFDMSDERREALVDAGRLAMRAYLDQPPAPAAVPRGQEAAAAQQAQREADYIAMNILAH